MVLPGAADEQVSTVVVLPGAADGKILGLRCDERVGGGVGGDSNGPRGEGLIERLTM